MSLVEEGRLVKDSRGLSKLRDPLSSSFYPSTISSDGIVGLCMDSMIAIGLSRLQPLRKRGILVQWENNGPGRRPSPM